MIFPALAALFLTGVMLVRYAGLLHPRLRCNCGLRHWIFPRRIHAREALLLLIAVLHTGFATCFILAWRTEPIDFVFIVVILIVTALDWYAWWVHSKNSRKKLMDKILGVVEVTVAGLKIKPVPA